MQCHENHTSAHAYSFSRSAVALSSFHVDLSAWSGSHSSKIQEAPNHLQNWKHIYSGEHIGKDKDPNEDTYT